MKLKFVSSAVMSLTFLLPSVVLAVPINLFNSGVDSAGNPLSGGSVDPHFSVLETGNAAVVMSYIPQNYLANSASSMWIWENASGFASNVNRTFRMTFDLSGFDHTTAVINGL